ncbi:beta-defensin 107A-like [Nycticebus coucang]|uniref:beta-defensin 107A-like n=1 Tax=Nycticebus coucang TaxID=9470 RepID=UPI00234D6015|nr:beta-defensin 107A-like [Nycticebus coucang]
MPGAMRIFFLIFAALVLLAQIIPARGGIQRQAFCKKLQGRCEAECLTFEDQIGGCRAESTPFCCKRNKH